ncbi:mediator complex subunit 25 PTOV activation and synapsin 2 domain-containing protein [Phthorimaea operculella]|nr:mediator complex subunit 25 PTOV activation and synapsin 2 domain-containing protein [Phthorimaea operculella]
MEKGKAPGDQQKVTRLLPCQVGWRVVEWNTTRAGSRVDGEGEGSGRPAEGHQAAALPANSKDIEPELKVDTWPNKLLMQLMPKQLISNIGGQYLKDSKSVLFHLQPNESLDSLTKVMVNGFAGCVHFSSPPQCDIKVLILLYTPDKKAYLGFIPNNQATFVDRLRKVIQQQKITQIINKQLPPGAAPGTMAQSMPTSTMTGGSSAMPQAGMSSGGIGQSGMSSGGMGQMGGLGGPVGGPGPSQGMGQQQHPQGMMMGGGMQGGMQQPKQLGGLEAARQQNLERIQNLQQTLEAAHQQEAQFKSQMDIMSHLQAAQQQELTYKQMESGIFIISIVNSSSNNSKVPAGGPARTCESETTHTHRARRPAHTYHPHTCTAQQPQYRPGGGGPRPNTQGQQFDDVNQYDFL